MARLLLIEDEPKIASFLTRALSAEGFAVDSVGDGRRGLELATTGHFDLVLLDLVLPELDGVSVLEGIMEVRPKQRVVVLSAYGDVEKRVRCLELGAVDYVAKPFAVRELVARVRTRMQEPNGLPPGRFLRSGSITLDLLRREASGPAGTVTLSQREFLLLQYVMQHEGQVCTREELLGSVWGYSFDPGTNVVDVYVRRLRAKLGRAAIETVRNVGYCIAA